MGRPGEFELFSRRWEARELEGSILFEIEKVRARREEADECSQKKKDAFHGIIVEDHIANNHPCRNKNERRLESTFVSDGIQAFLRRLSPGPRPPLSCQFFLAGRMSTSSQSSWGSPYEHEEEQARSAYLILECEVESPLPSEDRGSKKTWRLLLGNARALEDAMLGRAVVAHGSNLGFRVTHSLNVGDRFRRGRRRMPTREEVLGATTHANAGGTLGECPEREQAVVEAPPGVCVSLPLPDRLAMDADLDRRTFEPHLEFMKTSMRNAAALKPPDEDVTLLVNCNLCVNRSPFLTLLFLVECHSFSLRRAYRRIFSAGLRNLDPLPPYRRFLLELERGRNGAGRCSIRAPSASSSSFPRTPATTVVAGVRGREDEEDASAGAAECDWFAFHFTDPVFDEKEFDEVLEMRSGSIDRLLDEGVEEDDTVFLFPWSFLELRECSFVPLKNSLLVPLKKMRAAKLILVAFLLNIVATV